MVAQFCEYTKYHWHVHVQGVHCVIYKVNIICNNLFITIKLLKLIYINKLITVQSISSFSSVAQSCLTLCNPMGCSTPHFPVYHQLPELAQTCVHRVSDAIQPSQPQSSPSPLAFHLSQHQGLFTLHQVAKILEFQLQHQSFQWIFRTAFF